MDPLIAAAASSGVWSTGAKLMAKGEGTDAVAVWLAGGAKVMLVIFLQIRSIKMKEVSASLGGDYAKELGLIRPRDVCEVTHGTLAGVGGTDLIQDVKID